MYVQDGVTFGNPTEKIMDNEELIENKDEPAAAPAEEKPALTAEEKKAKNGKLMTVITYSLALLCMLLGIFVPLYGNPADGAATDRMLLKYIPGTLNMLLSPIAKKNIIPLPGNGFFFSFPAVDTFSFGALALIIYVLTCLVGLFLLIPVLLGNNKKRTCAVCAYVTEVLAALSTGYFIFTYLSIYAWGDTWYAYNFLIVFCGNVLAMAIQSVYNKGGLGVTKIVLAVLSAIVILFLVPLLSTVPGLGKAFDSLSKALHSGESAAFANGTDYTYGIAALNFTSYFKNSGLGLVDKLFYIIGGIFVCVCLFNFAYDVFAISAGTKYDNQGVLNQNKPMNVIAILRYTLALILAVVSIALLLVSKNVKPGVFLYFATLIVLIQLIFAIVRANVLSSKRKKAVKEDEISVKPDTEPNFHEDIPNDIQPVFSDDEPEFGNGAKASGSPKYVSAEKQTTPNSASTPVFESDDDTDYGYEEETYKPAYLENDYSNDEDEQLVIPGTPEPKQEDRTYVYNYRAVYNGPTDEFMNTLDDSEKIEFVQIFIEKIKGKIKGVPDYRIGQDNSDFFPAVFIRINRVRDIVSTHLLEKLYKQLGK